MQGHSTVSPGVSQGYSYVDFRLSSNPIMIQKLYFFSSRFSYIGVVPLCSIALLEFYSWAVPKIVYQLWRSGQPLMVSAFSSCSPFQSAHSSSYFLLEERYCAILSYLCLPLPILHLLLLSQAFIKVVPALFPKDKSVNTHEGYLIKD